MVWVFEEIDAKGGGGRANVAQRRGGRANVAQRGTKGSLHLIMNLPFIGLLKDSKPSVKNNE